MDEGEKRAEEEIVGEPSSGSTPPHDAATSRASAGKRPFQFSLSTMLIGTFCAAIFCYSLRVMGLLELLALAFVFTAILDSLEAR